MLFRKIFDLFSMFFFYVLSFYIMSFLYFCFSMFCRSMFCHRPQNIDPSGAGAGAGGGGGREFKTSNKTKEEIAEGGPLRVITPIMPMRASHRSGKQI